MYNLTNNLWDSTNIKQDGCRTHHIFTFFVNNRITTLMMVDFLP